MPCKLYNSRQPMISPSKLGLLALALVLTSWWTLHAAASDAANHDQAVADLANQIAAMTGSGQARLTVRNRSSLTTEEVSSIGKLLDRDLRGHGVIESGAQSAITIRVTLSENAAGGLWIAEVEEGTDVRVAMIPVSILPAQRAQMETGITLAKTLVWRQSEPVLDVLITQSATPRMIVLEPERIVAYTMTAASNGSSVWTKAQEFAIVHTRPFPRDLRGRLFAGAAIGSGHFFDVYLPGVSCSGMDEGSVLSLSCEDRDDPWPLADLSTAGTVFPSAQPGGAGNVHQKAFYNEMRSNFTGVLAPGFATALPPFYGAAPIARPAGEAMLISAVDGRVLMMENNSLKSVAATRDWGSDLAVISSGCGSGTQVVVSGSGAGMADSVRAYEIPGLEAEPVSVPLALEGSVMAVWPSGDGLAAMVVVRTEEVTATRTPHAEYEVYRVSAHCN